MAKTYAIYTVTNTQTGRVYIGMTADVRSRLYMHQKTLRCKAHFLPSMQKDFDAYGKGIFKYQVLLDGLAWEEAREIEKELISRADDPYNRSGNPNHVHGNTMYRGNASAAVKGRRRNPKGDKTMTDKETADKVAKMLQDLIEAGRETQLIKEGYLRIMGDLVKQVYKKHAKQQVNAAFAARRKANQRQEETQ